MVKWKRDSTVSHAADRRNISASGRIPTVPAKTQLARQGRDARPTAGLTPPLSIPYGSRSARAPITTTTHRASGRVPSPTLLAQGLEDYTLIILATVMTGGDEDSATETTLVVIFPIPQPIILTEPPARRQRLDVVQQPVRSLGRLQGATITSFPERATEIVWDADPTVAPPVTSDPVTVFLAARLGNKMT